MNCQTILSLFFLLSVSAVGCMEQVPSEEYKHIDNPILLIIHGYNREGCTSETLPEYSRDRQYLLLDHRYDLGQDRSFACIKKLIQEKELGDKQFILYGFAEGTLTALNYVAEEHSDEIKMLILESACASGNSMITHSEKQDRFDLSSLPLSYYWLPYLAKFKMPFYSPAGKQPILNIQKISKDLPVIIISSIQQESFNDAQALYAGLKLNGNTAYLFAIDKKADFDLLKEKKQDIRKILQNHSIPLVQTGETDQSDGLSAYQPTPDLAAYHELVSKENIFTYLDPCLKIIVLASVLGVCVYAFNQPQPVFEGVNCI